MNQEIKDNIDGPVHWPIECSSCNSTGYILIEHTDYITRDMAVDAGAEELEGQPISYGSELIPCPECS